MNTTKRNLYLFILDTASTIIERMNRIFHTERHKLFAIVYQLLPNSYTFIVVNPDVHIQFSNNYSTLRGIYFEQFNY